MKQPKPFSLFPKLLLLALVLGLASCSWSSRAPQKLDYSDILDLALWSMAAYQPPARLAEGVSLTQFDNEQVKGRLLVVRSQSNPVQVVAVRGTQNRSNLKQDMSIAAEMVREQELAGHKGFLQHADALLHDLEAQAFAPLDQDQPLLLTGHSLGGAVALLLGLKLQERGFRVVGVVTFGQPPLFETKDAGYDPGFPVIRVVVDEDRVKLGSKISGFVHLNRSFELRLYEGGGTTVSGPDFFAGREEVEDTWMGHSLEEEYIPKLQIRAQIQATRFVAAPGGWLPQVPAWRIYPLGAQPL